MENSSDDNSESFELPHVSFWSAYSSLKGRISALQRKRSFTLSECNPYQMCVDIEEKILNHDEEPNLSPLLNKIRKLNIGSNLCKDVCIIHRDFANLEMNKAVSLLLEEGKYSSIAERILQRKKNELKREKYFQLKAINTFKDCLEDINEKGEIVNNAVNTTPRETFRPQESQIIAEIDGGEIPENHIVNERLTDNLRQEILGPENSISFSPEMPAENLRVFNHNLEAASLSAAGLRFSELTEYLDIPVPELLARLSESRSEFNYDLKEIENIVEGISDLPQDGRSELVRDDQSETYGTSFLNVKLNNGVTELDDLGDLPDITVLPQERKRRLQPVFDPLTVIPGYAKRACRLNRSIVVKRVEVYKGPPSTLHSFSVGHLMTQTSVIDLSSPITRSSVIERLYIRQLKTRKVPNTELANVFRRHSTVRRAEKEIEEEVGSKRELHSMARSQTRDVSLIEANIGDAKEMMIPETNTTVSKVGSLRGTSVSRLLPIEIMPPAPIGKSSPWIPSRSPRIQNLQGTRIEEPSSEPWFMSVSQPIPSEKWREFKYVRICLAKMWKRKEESNLERSTTLNEILESERDSNRENKLTLLRIIDKMSIRREIVLKGTGTDVTVYPYEIPYVTEKQYSLRQGIQKF